MITVLLCSDFHQCQRHVSWIGWKVDLPTVVGSIYKPLRGSFTLHYWEDGGRVKSPAHPVMINCHSHSAHYSLLPPPPPSPLSGFLSSSFIGLLPLPPSPPTLSGFLLLLVYSAFSYSISSSFIFTLITFINPFFCIFDLLK